MKVKDVIAWSGLIRDYAQHCRTKHVPILFERMKKEGMIPNRATYICTLSPSAGKVEVLLKLQSSFWKKFHDCHSWCGMGIASKPYMFLSKCSSKSRLLTRLLLSTSLSACDDPCYLYEGKDIHAGVSQSGPEANLDAIIALVIIYGVLTKHEASLIKLNHEICHCVMP